MNIPVAPIIYAATVGLAWTASQPLLRDVSNQMASHEAVRAHNADVIQAELGVDIHDRISLDQPVPEASPLPESNPVRSANPAYVDVGSDIGEDNNEIVLINYLGSYLSKKKDAAQTPTFAISAPASASDTETVLYPKPNF
jgi:hypothetical protein